MQHFSVSRKNFLNHPLVLLNHSDNLSKTLQSPHLSASQGQKIAQMTVCALQSLRSDDNFLLFWTKVIKMASDLGVNNPVSYGSQTLPVWAGCPHTGRVWEPNYNPVLPRQRKRPKMAQQRKRFQIKWRFVSGGVFWSYWPHCWLYQRSI